MKLDLPEPVAPATSRCGILARLATTKPPSTSLPSADHHRVVVAARGAGAQHVAERDDLLVEVGDLDADRATCRGSGEGCGRRPSATAYEMFLRQRGDLLDLDRRAELDLVAGDGRAAGEAGDLGVDVELLEHLGEPVDHGVAGLGARLVRRAGLEHVVAGQRVDDVAGQRELLDALRQRRVRRRLELAVARPTTGVDLRRPGRASGVGAAVDGLRPRLALDARGPRAPGCRTPGRPSSGSIVARGVGPRLPATRARIGRVGSRSSGRSSLLGRRARPSARSRASRQPVRHLVERGGGDDQDPEDGTAAAGRAPRRTACGAGRAGGGDDVADGAATLAQRAGVAGDGLRVALGDVDDAEHAEGRARPSRRPGGRPGRCRSGRAGCASRPRAAPAAPASRPCRRSR